MTKTLILVGVIGLVLVLVIWAFIKLVYFVRGEANAERQVNIETKEEALDAIAAYNRAKERAQL